MERPVVAHDQAIRRTEEEGAMLYGCSTWTLRSQTCSSMRTTHHKLLLRVVGFRREDRTGYKPLSYGEALERTGSQRTETIFWSVNMGSLGPLFGEATQGG